MSDQRIPAVKGVTPIGIALFPKLAEPDTKYDKDGSYTIKVVLAGASAEELVSKLDFEHGKAYELFKKDIAEAKAKEKNPKKRAEIKERADVPFTEVFENDEPTGEYRFNFKMKASGISKKTGKPWSRQPAVFNAKGKALSKTEKEAVGNGSKVRVSYEISPFYTPALGAGISLRLEAVQVVELKSFGDRSASAFGFGEEEGYDGADIEANTAGFTDESTGDSADGDF